jgi:hypothetical protein
MCETELIVRDPKEIRILHNILKQYDIKKLPMSNQLAVLTLRGKINQKVINLSAKT